MTDAPEIPEANDAFQKRVALTIAILATSRWFWYSSMGAGLVGSAIGISGYFI